MSENGALHPVVVLADGGDAIVNARAKQSTAAISYRYGSHQNGLPELPTATERAPGAPHVSDIASCFCRERTRTGSD